MDLSLRVRDVVRALRLGESAQASDWLVGVIDALADALHRPPLACEAARILPILERVLEAQVRCDTLWLADLLEYQLLPVVQSAG